MSSEPACPTHASNRRGELLVLGSGFAHPDLLLNDEAQIRSADDVFHCMYDRVTQIWIDRIRPDALDLRILYHPANDRHDTYVCMAEAMLHRVRQGRKVVAVFYGHPGMFATPTHRAIRVARAEGHRALMRPGISALDYLVADVGFDPMIPGLISYEATDLLIRRRRLDPTLHTVLWQVGVVGELQYAPGGFKNRGFDRLVDELVAAYGAEAELVHYIAPQYVGIEPLIDRHRMGSLPEPETRARISAMSTFYIPPVRSAPINPEAGAAFGYATEQLDASTSDHDFDLAAYDDREKAALRRFADFEPDTSYRLPGASPAAEFMLAMSRDPALLEQYRADPAAVLADPRFGDLTDRARKLLEIPHPLAINAAIAEPPRT